MIYSNTTLSHIALHFVGNKNNEEELTLSNNLLEPDDNLTTKLQHYFLNKFENVFEKFHFHHASSLSFNEVFSYTKSIFNNTDKLLENSQNIAKHLFEKSVHPKIKAGELYVCYFKNCFIDGENVDALGLFKTETKNGFFEINKHKNNFDIFYKEGVDINKFDKGCLILNKNIDLGFEVYIIDNQNRGEEAQYWKEQFLGLNQISNDFHQTSQFMGIAKQFVTKQLTEEFEATKADQIDLLNRSVEYFKNHDSFNKAEFEQEVFQDNEIINSFRNFDEEFRTTNQLELPNHFDISHQAVKKQAKVFKSVLKLDKNFHIYIHGNKELIERGVDENGRKFYKLYFTEEN